MPDLVTWRTRHNPPGGDPNFPWVWECTTTLITGVKTGPTACKAWGYATSSEEADRKGTEHAAATHAPAVTARAELLAAADKLRKMIDAVPRELWGDRPWHVEECANREPAEINGCPCIVTQGEYKPFDQAQVPLIQYVADAETPEHAHYIAAMHPGVGNLIVDLLRAAASYLDGSDSISYPSHVVRAYAVARALNSAPEA